MYNFYLARSYSPLKEKSSFLLCLSRKGEMWFFLLVSPRGIKSLLWLWLSVRSRIVVLSSLLSLQFQLWIEFNPIPYTIPFPFRWKSDKILWLFVDKTKLIVRLVGRLLSKLASDCLADGLADLSWYHFSVDEFFMIFRPSHRDSTDNSRIVGYSSSSSSFPSIHQMRQYFLFKFRHVVCCEYAICFRCFCCCYSGCAVDKRETVCILIGIDPSTRSYSLLSFVPKIDIVSVFTNVLPFALWF